MQRILAIAVLACSSGFATVGSKLVTSAMITNDIVDCESGDSETRTLCSLVLARVNAELDARGITIDKDGVLFTYDDPDNQNIPTGHSCTVTAKVKHKHATVRLGRGANLDLSGNSLTRPLALKLELPVSLDAKLDIKQSFGNRLAFGSCNDYASDSYEAKAKASTDAQLLVGLKLNPSFGEMPSGDYAVTIKPDIAVAAALKDVDLDFHISGVSPISAVWGFLTGFPSTIFRSTEAALKGNSVSDIIRTAGTWDLASLVVLGIGALPGNLERGLWDALFKDEIKDFVGDFTLDLQRNLRAKIANALKLDAEGKRVIIIKREYMELLSQLGNGAPVFVEPPVDPSLACRTQVNQQCQSCAYVPAGQQEACGRSCGVAQQACNKLGEEFKRLFPVKLTPMTPIFQPEPPPVVTPPEKTPRQKCLEAASAMCSACRGCSACQTRIAECNSMPN